MTIGSIKLFKKDNSDKILLGNPSYSFWKIQIVKPQNLN